MKWPLYNVILAAVIFSIPVRGQVLEPVAVKDVTPSSIDVFGKVEVHGEVGAVRSRILGIAVDVRDELYELLGIDEGSQKHLLQVNLYGKEGEKAPEVLFNKSFYLVLGEVFFRLDVHLAEGVNEEELRRNFVDLYLHEIAFRDEDTTGMDSFSVRETPWLSLGVFEALNWQRDKIDRVLYTRLFQQGAVYPIGELLSDDELETGFTALDHAFRVSSGALVMALLNQEQGKKGLLSLVKEASFFEGEQKALISKNFPDTTLSKNSLAKWWGLQLATMTKTSAGELQTLVQTESDLTSILNIEHVLETGELVVYTPSQFNELKTSEVVNLRKILLQKTNELALLKSRCFPSYRALVDGYQQALLATIKVPKKKSFWSFFSRKESAELDVDEMFRRLEEERLVLSQVGERVTDYLNWYEIEQAQSQSSEFSDYLFIKKELDQSNDHDEGPISQYLEDIEKLYEK